MKNLVMFSLTFLVFFSRPKDTTGQESVSNIKNKRSYTLSMIMERSMIRNENILREGGSESRFLIGSNLDRWHIFYIRTGLQISQPYNASESYLGRPNYCSDCRDYENNFEKKGWRDNSLIGYHVRTQLEFSIVHFIFALMKCEVAGPMATGATFEAGLPKNKMGIYLDGKLVITHLYKPGDVVTVRDTSGWVNKGILYRQEKITYSRRNEFRYGISLSVGMCLHVKVPIAIYVQGDFGGSFAQEARSMPNRSYSKSGSDIREYKSGPTVGIAQSFGLGISLDLVSFKRGGQMVIPERVLFCPRF